MLRNRSLQFQCEHVHVRVEQTDTPFTASATPRQVLRIPIAHGEGNYYAEPDVIARLEKNRQIVFRYTNPDRRPHRRIRIPTDRPANIAGLCNERAQHRWPDAASRARV